MEAMQQVGNKLMKIGIILMLMVICKEDGFKHQIQNGIIIDEETREIIGVQAGTVADLKADISAYDGGIIKVVADGTALSNGKIIAVKAQDGTTKSYRISLFGSVSPVINHVIDTNVTTSAAANWEAPETTATDSVDGKKVTVTYYIEDAAGNSATISATFTAI